MLTVEKKIEKIEKEIEEIKKALFPKERVTLKGMGKSLVSEKELEDAIREAKKSLAGV